MSGYFHAARFGFRRRLSRTSSLFQPADCRNHLAEAAAPARQFSMRGQRALPVARAKPAESVSPNTFAQVRDDARRDFFMPHAAAAACVSSDVARLSANAAGHDQIKIAQIGGDVIREAVRSHPAAQVHADRPQFFGPGWAHRPAAEPLAPLTVAQPRLPSSPAIRLDAIPRSAVARIIASSKPRTYQATSRRSPLRSRIG